MGIVLMVVLIVFIVTMGKVAQTLLARPPGEALGSGEERVRRLETELRSNELRLAQTEDRVAELGEKLLFLEKLLEAPKEPGRLPGPPDEGGGR